jgi:soluble lytic murein transglycosylase
MAARAFVRGDHAEVVRRIPKKASDPEAGLLRARSLIALKQYAEAEQELAGPETALPHLRDLVRFLQAEVLFGLGRHAEAAERFRAAARVRNSRWVYSAWRRRAEALRAGSQFRLAAEEYRHLIRILSKDPSRPEWEVALALCQEKLGQRQAGAESLQEVWLTWPELPAAAHARKELDRLLRAGARVKPAPLSRRLARIRVLRRERLHGQAVTELRALREQERRSADSVAIIDLELALTLMKDGQAAQALAALRTIPLRRRGYPPAWHVHRLMADCLARTGQVEEAAALLLQDSDRTKGKPSSAQQAAMKRAAKLLAEHARYPEALKLEERLASLSKTPAVETRYRLAWLAYRAGLHDLALQRLEAWAKRARTEKDFALYWMARAHERAGRPDKAHLLYQELLAKHGATYYGALARSRLAEAGKLKLPSGTCSDTAGGASDPAPSSPAALDEVTRRLAAFITRWGDLYPSLQRVQTLWRLGMLQDARRELRLVAIDAAWIMVKGRSREWIQRPTVERLWRDGPLETRRFGKRERQVAKVGTALRHELGEMLSRAGISYFGLQLGKPDPDPLRRRYPRAYPELVRQVAHRYRLDPNLIWAIMNTESSYRLDVISRVGATGLMQIMPHTGRRIAADMKLATYEPNLLFDPETNLMMAGYYLQALSKKFQGQLRLVAAAYNGGPHHVGRWLDMRGQGASMDEFIEEIPFAESRRYAKKILRLVVVYERLYCGKEDRIAANTLDRRYAPDPDF